MSVIMNIDIAGDLSRRDTPVSIPNTVVKPLCADGTALDCGRVGRCQLFFSKGYLFKGVPFFI